MAVSLYSPDGIDAEHLRRLESLAPIQPYEVIPDQITASSLGMASHHVVVWEQRAAAQVLYVPPTRRYNVVLHCREMRRLIQWRRGHGCDKPMATHELTIVPPQVPAYFRSFDVSHNLHLSITPSALHEAIHGEPATGDAADVRLRDCFADSDPQLAALATAAITQIHSPRPASHKVLDFIHAAIVAHLVERYAERMAPAIGQLSVAEVRRVSDYIQSNLSQRLSLSSIAGLLGLSPYHFARLFKAATGVSPMRFVTDMRLQQAHDLLRAGSRSVLEIANDTGFADGSHLSRHYRRKYGHAPALGRRSRKL